MTPCNSTPPSGLIKTAPHLPESCTAAIIYELNFDYVYQS